MIREEWRDPFLWVLLPMLSCRDPLHFPRMFPSGTKIAFWFVLADHPDDRSNVYFTT